MGDPVRAPDGIVESESAGGAVRGAEAGHPASVAHRPALPGTLHPRLQDVPVGALDGAAADGETLLAQQAVLHSVQVRPVVADQVVERLQRVRLVASALLHLRDALHQLGDDRLRALGEQRLGALLPEREVGTLLAEQDLSAVDGVLHGVVPVEDLHCIRGELIGQRPVARSSVPDPNDQRDLVDLLDVQRFLEDRGKFAEAVDHRDVAGAFPHWPVGVAVVAIDHAHLSFLPRFGAADWQQTAVGLDDQDFCRRLSRLELFLQLALVGRLALSADSSDHPAQEVLRNRLLVVQIPAGRTLAVDVVDGEVEHALLHLAGQLTLFGEVEEAIHRVEAVLALLAVVVVALEGDRAREATHCALPVAHLYRRPLSAFRTRLAGRLLWFRPAEHRLDPLIAAVPFELLDREFHVRHRHVVPVRLFGVTAGQLLQQLVLREGPKALFACHSRDRSQWDRRCEAPLRKRSKSLRLFSAPKEKPQSGRAPTPDGCQGHALASIPTWPLVSSLPIAPPTSAKWKKGSSYATSFSPDHRRWPGTHGRSSSRRTAPFVTSCARPSACSGTAFRMETWGRSSRKRSRCSSTTRKPHFGVPVPSWDGSAPRRQD